MKRKAGLFLMLLGAASILCAAALLIFNRVEDQRAGQAAARAMPQVERLITHRRMLRQALEQPVTTAEPEPTLPSLPHPPGPAKTLEMPREEIDGYPYIGILSLPTLGRELPVLAELQMPWLQVAPCRCHGSVYTDDLVIGAHNYSWHFGTISDLLPGDPVYVTDLDGIVNAYAVTGTEILQPTDVDALISSDGDLVLFTCTYGGGSRIAVRCQRAAVLP